MTLRQLTGTIVLPDGTPVELGTFNARILEPLPTDSNGLPLSKVTTSISGIGEIDTLLFAPAHYNFSITTLGGRVLLSFNADLAESEDPITLQELYASRGDVVEVSPSISEQIAAAIAGIDYDDTYAQIDHNHDDLYYRQSVIDVALAGKSSAGHNHDATYYTQAQVDAMLDAKEGYEVGDIKMQGGVEIGENWRVCDGSEVSRAEFPALLLKIGIGYGAGNGTTTFNLPNLVGRFPLAAGAMAGSSLTPRAVGESGGEESVTLTEAEMPAHRHGIQASSVGNSFNPVGNYPGRDITEGTQPYSTTADNAMAVDAITLTGGGAAHENMPPFLVVPFLIKVQ